MRRLSAFAAPAAAPRVAPNGDVVIIEDSKNPDVPVLAYDSTEWETFFEGIRQGDFDDL